VKLVIEVYLEQNLKIPFISALATSASRANGNGLKNRGFYSRWKENFPAQICGSHSGNF
jgi:hypothetical protein